jgi:hypothetical protein
MTEDGSSTIMGETSDSFLIFQAFFLGDRGGNYGMKYTSFSKECPGRVYKVMQIAAIK